MNKKIFAVTVVTILILLGVTTVTNASMSIQRSVEEKAATANKKISLGSVTIYGDGVEGNTLVDAIAGTGLTVKIGSDQVNADFNMSYSMQCLGEDDLGVAILLVQSGGRDLGYGSVFTSEIKDGDLKIENALIKKNELLTYELLGLYINTDPAFMDLDVGIGGALIVKPRNIPSRLYGSALVQLLEKLPLFSRLSV